MVDAMNPIWLLKRIREETPARLVFVLLLIATAPWVVKWTGTGSFFLRVAIVGLIYLTSAVAWDLVGGLVGQVSFGHAAFFGIGAYVTTLLVRAGIPDLLCLFLAAMTAALYGIMWGWPCLRLRGPFFAIASIGVGEATRLFALNWESVTGGATGLTLPLENQWAGNSYLLALSLAVVSIGVSLSVRRSRLGLGLSCIRENIDAAESIGIRTGWLQLQVFALSAALVGAAGGIYAKYLFYVAPGDVFAFDRSVGFILMAVIGGVNTVWGPAIGAFFFLLLERFLQIALPNLHLGIYGLLLVLIMLYQPQGFVALVAKIKKSRPLARMDRESC